MSKDFGIAGIRAGYAIMSEAKINHLLKTGFLWNSNSFSEYFLDYTVVKFLITTKCRFSEIFIFTVQILNAITVQNLNK